jgi:uncharacterized protein (TIGR00251 family)
MVGVLPWRVENGALLVAVRLTPKGGRDALDGVETLADGRAVLKARVRAVPEDGKANDALIRLVCRACRLPASSVALTSGATSRFKTLRIDGEPETIAAHLNAALGTAAGR